jgi:hypothetical protein
LAAGQKPPPIRHNTSWISKANATDRSIRDDLPCQRMSCVNGKLRSVLLELIDSEIEVGCATVLLHSNIDL